MTFHHFMRRNAALGLILPLKMAHEAQPTNTFMRVFFVHQPCTVEFFYWEVFCCMDQVKVPLFQISTASNSYSKRIKVSITAAVYEIYFKCKFFMVKTNCVGKWLANTPKFLECRA